MQGSWADIEHLDFQIAVDDPAFVVLRTHLLYDLHVRPTTYVYTQLRDLGVVDRIGVRRTGVGSWVEFEPLSLLALALRRGEEVQIRVSNPMAKPELLAIMEAFRSCPLFRDYSARDRVAVQDVGCREQSEREQFCREFEATDDRSCLVKLHLENFLLGHTAEIEAHVLTEFPARTLGDAVLERCLGDLVDGGLEQFGISSLAVPYDNLMQIRDMCYHLHFKQLERGTRIPYALINIEWSREFGPDWRRRQGARQRYFFEREANFYRELFLLLVRREPALLNTFVHRWSERLDYSLRLREDLRNEIQKFSREMDNFTPNFDNPEEFRNHIRVMGERVVKNIARLTPFVQLLREHRIFAGQRLGGAASGDSYLEERRSA